jgi:hypothetical protein
MTIFKTLPPLMLSDIDRFLEVNRSKCIPVYAEAEKIRQRWELQNIALEDIVATLVERCGMHDVAMSFERRDAIDVLIEEDEGEESSQKYA